MVVSLYNISKTGLGNMLAMTVWLILIYFLYLGAYIPHIFFAAPMTKRMKHFSN